MYNSIELVIIYVIFFMIGLMLAGQAILMKLISSNWNEVESTITRIEIYNK